MGPTDVGPLVSLPTGQLVGAVILGSAVGSLIFWLALRNIRPDDQMVALWGGGAALAAHFVAIAFERPWRTQRLGRWAFTLLHGSVISVIASLAAFALLYSATRLPEAPLGLTVAGVWFIGNFAKVLAYGRFARAAGLAVSAEPTGVV